MKLSIILISGIFVISPSGLGAACADGAEERPADSVTYYYLDEIVVTAKREEIRIKDLAVSVSMIGSYDIETSILNSTTDLSGALPGVFIHRTGDFGRSDVNVRGLGSRGRRTLVLVDGRPEQMALFGCTVTHSFPMHDTERIEVVKGASSVLYGSGALGGVLNIIPKSVGEKMQLDFKAGSGSFNTSIASGRIGKRYGGIFGVISMDYRCSDGHVEHSSYEGTDFIARGGWSISSSLDIDASVKYFSGFKEEPLALGSDAAGEIDTWNDYKRGAVDVRLEADIEGLKTHTRYYRSFGEHEFSDGWHSIDETDGFMIHSEVHPSGGLELVFGADYRNMMGELPENRDASWSKWEAGGYIGADYDIRGRVAASAGGRYNRDEVSGDRISPFLGLVGTPRHGTTMRASVSHGFRSPQLNELYMFASSNERLEAETAWNYEVGIIQSIARGIMLDAAAFRIDGEKFIELESNESPPPLFMYTNSGSLRFYGAEIALAGEWGIGLNARVSLSYLDTGRWTAGRPGKKIDLAVAFKRDCCTIKMTGSNVDDYYAHNGWEDRIDAYTVLDLYAEAALPARGMRIFAGLGNLFDERYAVYTDLPGGAAGLYMMPGRRLTFGVKYGR